MATAEVTPAGMLRSSEESVALANQLRRLARVATFVAVLTSPAAYFFFHKEHGFGVGKSILLTALVVIGFRGLVDLVIRRLIPWPSLFGTEDARLREEDVVNRRRAWTWRFYYRVGIFLAGIITLVFLKQYFFDPTHDTWPLTGWHILQSIGHLFTNRGFWLQMVFVLFLFLANFLIFMGPMMLMGISQIRGYEPGDAEWGVKLEDVRGQQEAKEEVRRVVTLWQSGEAFERAGGKRERGLLFLGAPGTGKTMLAKAIATGFNSPFVSIPGSGFAQTFIGIDALIVRFLARKAKKLARKWGGQCIVFIDEIDAVGMRRQSLQGANKIDAFTPTFYGPFGSLTPSGDLYVEDETWRNWLFEQRAPERQSPYPAFIRKLAGTFNDTVHQGGAMGLWGGTGQLALNQLLVLMDGMDNPPFTRRLFTNKLNTWLDATYVIPRRIGKISLRLPRPRPRKDQIYFIGATNVPLQNLDPALTRPGRMGRHVWFRTPTKEDRKDIFELYLGKVAHDPELDTPHQRDEIARITNGYSPAMIDQVCSMALTYAQHDGRAAFERADLLQAMSVIESGAAVEIKYVEHETVATAIHEAGHAAAAHVYVPWRESSRLTIKMRGDGSLGHHMTFSKEERFSKWNHELFGELIWGLAAMAAEYVFYNENSNGVGGDLAMTTQSAAWMVGASGMSPPPLNVPKFADETEEQTRTRVAKQLERVGAQLMNRTRGGADFHGDPVAAILGDPIKRGLTAQLMGQAFVTAYNFIRINKDGVERVATELAKAREIYGDHITRLLDAQHFVKPEVDWLDEASWPSEIEWRVPKPPEGQGQWRPS